MELSPFQRTVRRVVKRFVYSQLYLREALFIVLGRAKPLVRFKVEATPPSIYFNFELKPEWVERLEDELGLPHPLAEVRCLEGEEPFYCITLNVYRVSGLANGMRAEWSLYIREPSSGKPRYVIVEARADAGSMDPMVIISRAGEVRHEGTEEAISSEVVCEDGGRFRSVCRKPDAGRPVRAAPEWIEANDYIYWLNGICDRTFYDAGLANARVVQLDPASVEIHDGTRWGDMVEPTPRHVLVFQEAIEFAMSPWWNVDETPPAPPGPATATG
jgi:hypothetical protein